MPGSPRSLDTRALAALSAVLGADRMRGRHGAVALLTAAILWICAASPVQALNLDVDTPGDSAALAFQACTAAPGDCTLRGAILRANAVAGPHTITLQANTYTVSIQNPGGVPDDTALAGDLDILQTITITGVSQASTVITWNESIPLENRDRVFHVRPSGNLTVRDATIRQGGRGIPAADVGGGVFAEGPLTLERVSVRVNHQAYGGGIAIDNTAVIRDSTIHNNDGQFGAGVHISNPSSAFTVSIENTTISSNGATNRGGGLRVLGAHVNTVITLNNVTVASNNGGSQGGGLSFGIATVVLRNTIVANNTASSSTPNCEGTPVSQGYNLVFGGDACGMSAGNNDIVNTGSPNLGPLQDNGGPTNTHALGTGSAALDKGNPAVPGSGGNACAATDQRGLARTIDGDGDGVVRCDIGAVEGGRWFVVDSSTDNGALLTCDTDPNNGNCSLRGAITMANAFTVASVITLPARGAGDPYRLMQGGVSDDLNNGGDLDIRTDITIVGGGAASTIIDGNQLDRVFDVRTSGTRRLKLQDLTVQNGKANADGGGINSTHDLSLLRVRLRANTSDGNGGGIFISGANLTITESTVSGNVAPDLGDGGGIYHEIGSAASASLTITNSTLTQNQADFGGGLIATGGVTTTLNNVTIAGNIAVTNAGGIRHGSPMFIRNSIVANNTAPINPNCGGAGAPTSQGYNLVNGGGNCGFTQGTDRQNQDPRLGPLKLNGGTTETMALGAGSAAIDAGNPATPGSGGTSCAATDQRGTPRPINGDIVGGAVCDIGAYEAAICTSNRPRVTTGVTPGSPGRLTVTVFAGTGVIAELRLHALPQTNIQVSIGGLTNQTGDFTVPINATVAQFSIRRTTGVGSGTLPFDVVDGCGVWQSLAGGGPNAWPAGSSAVGEPSAPETTRTQTATPPPGCAPQRPNVGVTTVKQGDGRLQATLSAQTSPGVPTNSLSSVQIGAINNADVTLNGSPVAAGHSVTLPAGTQQATLIVDRDEEARRAFGVGLVVTDACGEWKTFVGSGPGG